MDPRPLDADIGRELATQLVAQPQPGGHLADTRADTGPRVVIAPGLGLDPPGEDQAVGEQPVVLALQPQAELSALAEVAGRLDVEPLRCQPLQADGQVGPRRAGPRVHAQAGNGVPPGRHGLPVEELQAVADL